MLLRALVALPVGVMVTGGHRRRVPERPLDLDWPRTPAQTALGSTAASGLVAQASAGTACMGHRGSAAHPTRLLGSAEDRVGADALAALSKHHQRALRVVVALGLCTPQLKR